MKTKILSIFLIFFLFLPVEAAEIWSEKTETVICEGVRLVHDERFSASGWERVHILEMDAENENLSLTAMYDSRGISKSKNVLKMAEENGVVAAVNGDFFNWSGTPLGFTVKDGEVISSPSHDTGLAAFMETEEGEFLFDYMDMSLFVTCPEGYKAEIIHINKVHSMESMVLYTPAWGEKTPGSFDGVSELVVSGGIVTDIRLEMEGVEVPEDGYVIATSTKTSTYLVDNFKIGDKVELSFTLTPDTEKIKTAIGGGTVLVKDGKVAKFTNNIEGNHPRTAIGVSEDGKKVFLVAVDGRLTATPGFSQTRLAEYMISLGAYGALNLDGGGSTTMVARDNGGTLKVVNSLSDGALRPVVTAVGIEYSGKPGKAQRMTLSAQSYGFKGEGIPLSVTFFDKAGNPVSSDETVRYKSKNGKIKDGILYADQIGECTVTASCGTMEAEKTITILDKTKPFSKEKPKEGESVLLLPGLFSKKTMLGAFINGKLNALAKGDEKVFTFGEYEALPGLAVNKYSASSIENSLFVTVNTGKGGIRASDAAVWENIFSLCDTKREKNIFFLLSTPLSEFADDKEAALFKRTIKEKLLANEKNVYVISVGETIGETEEDGAIYITVPHTASLSASDLYNADKGGLRLILYKDTVYAEKVSLWNRKEK